MIPQGPGGIRGPSVALQGSSVTVTVESGHKSIYVHSGANDIKHYPVGPDTTATFPVPDVPPGTVLFVVAGTGNRKKILLIEVLSLSP